MIAEESSRRGGFLAPAAGVTDREAILYDGNNSNSGCFACKSRESNGVSYVFYVLLPALIDA